MSYSDCRKFCPQTYHKMSTNHSEAYFLTDLPGLPVLVTDLLFCFRKMSNLGLPIKNDTGKPQYSCQVLLPELGLTHILWEQSTHNTFQIPNRKKLNSNHHQKSQSIRYAEAYIPNIWFTAKYVVGWPIGFLKNIPGTREHIPSSLGSRLRDDPMTSSCFRWDLMWRHRHREHYLRRILPLIWP